MTNDNPNAEIKTLRETVMTMDTLSQDGFSVIALIARLALSRMETPQGCSNQEYLAEALSAIRNKADDIMNCINGEAENVGCNYVDDAARRRYEAVLMSKASQGSGTKEAA
jgi:hypothetical protein